jgi:hypothetical protein
MDMDAIVGLALPILVVAIAKWLCVFCEPFPQPPLPPPPPIPPPSPLRPNSYAFAYQGRGHFFCLVYDDERRYEAASTLLCWVRDTGCYEKDEEPGLSAAFWRAHDRGIAMNAKRIEEEGPCN